MTLSPCPFCGGTNVTRSGDDYGDFLMCGACGVCGPRVEFNQAEREEDRYTIAIELWNQRAPTLFGLPIVEVDDLGDASQIVLGPPLI